MSNTILDLYHVGCRVNSEFYLRDITFSLEQGQALAVMGKNASGKSTLFSMLMGVFPATAGEIHIAESTVKLTTTEQAVAQGILLLGQNQPVFENMKVYENIYFAHELQKGKLLDNSRMCSETAQLLSKLGSTIQPMQSMLELSQAGRQIVGLARAMCTGARLILMDEPSCYLDSSDKKLLWKAIEKMKQAGKSFLIITHDPAEALAVAENISFMENGTLSAPEASIEHTEESLLPRAYGMTYAALYHRDHYDTGEEILRMALETVSFSVKRGEIVAMIGDGAVAQKLLACLGGLSSFTGHIIVGGKELSPSPLSAIAGGVSLALDDKAEAELAAAREMIEHGGKANGGSKLLFHMQRVASGLGGAFGNWVGMGRKGEYTTGGCRRREMMERALARRAVVYGLMEPSAGLDLPSRMRLYDRFGQIAKEGAALLFSTGNIAEAAGIADRLLVFRDGTLLCDIPADKAQEAQKILQ